MLKSIFKYFQHDQKNSNNQVAENPPAQPLPIPSPNSSSIDGYAYIENNKLVVVDPKNYGFYATVIVPDDDRLEFRIDGKKTIGEVVVSELYQIDVVTRGREPSTKRFTRVSEDKLSVSAIVQIETGSSVMLSNSRPSLQTEFVIEEYAEEREVEPVSPYAILTLLKEQNFHGEIDYSAIHRLCQLSTSGEEVVLRGIAPSQGEPDHLNQINLPVEKDDELRLTHPSLITAGTIIVDQQLGKEGTPGRDVYGFEIPASQNVKPLTLGQGVIRVNTHIVAAKNGRLIFSKQRIDVVSECVVDHDVTSADGKIVFDGNVIVKGSVLDGAHIHATESVIVYGDVFHSTIYAEQDVIVARTIHNSKVWAGNLKTIYSDLSPLLLRMISGLEKLKEEYLLMKSHVLKRYDAHAVLPKISSALLEKRHVDLLDDLEFFVKEYQNHLSIDREYQSLSELLCTKWKEVQLTPLLEEDIQNLLSKMKDYHDRIVKITPGISVIRVSNAISSYLNSYGNIFITDKGCFSSNLESKKAIAIRGSLRGGFATAYHAVSVGELGNSYGMESSVRVTSLSGMIKIALRHSNTLVELCGKRDRCYSEENNLYLRGDTINDQNPVSRRLS